MASVNAPSSSRKYYAHTAEDADGNRDPDESKWQPLAEHLQNVATLAAKFAAPFGAEKEAHLAGLLHDLGKYRDEFQAYLRGKRASSAETQHAIFGAAWAAAEYRPQLFASKLAIAGHHAGLHNHCDLEGMCCKPSLRISETIPALIALFEKELGPLPRLPTPPTWVLKSLEIDNAHAAEFYTRLIFSCIVDADRLDSAHWPASPLPDTRFDADTLLAAVHTERSHKAKINPDSPLAALRNRIFDTALERAALAPGFFSMTVPTGGGKTLASMAFALAHSRRHGLRRIIVVIPYLSIIEQNAAEYRRIFGDGIVLENHSGVTPSEDAEEEEKSRLELVSENWDAPIIVTTSVQFLESLFAASPVRCRKLHRIPRSVVIFDEVQTLPAHLLAPTFNVLRELAANYETSFVFSSATQPAFRRCPALPDGFLPSELREIAPSPYELFKKLRRVTYRLPSPGETFNWPTLATSLAAPPQVLCVVNLTRHARELWEQLSQHLRQLNDFGLPYDEAPIHLSSSMCAQHRLDLIARIKERLRLGQPCRVVSTQMIEAEVDVDFPEVWRAIGPLDSIVQVAATARVVAPPALSTFSSPPTTNNHSASTAPPRTKPPSPSPHWVIPPPPANTSPPLPTSSPITSKHSTKWSIPTTPNPAKPPFQKKRWLPCFLPAAFLDTLPELIVSEDWRPLPLTLPHALQAGRFDSPHRDPFDRLLAAQAMIDDLTLVTIDDQFSGFGVKRLW
jgi:CRISPR-associated endonuclease/helicase Cas3